MSEKSFEFTMGQEEFLMILAASPDEAMSLPAIAAAVDPDREPRSKRNVYKIADQLTEWGMVDFETDQTPPKRRFHEGSSSTYYYHITDEYAPELLEELEAKAKRLKAAIRGLKRQLDL